MSILALANALVNWQRSTAVLLELRSYAASMTATRQPVRATCVQVQVNGSPSGTLTVTGTVGGAAATEALVWTGIAGARATLKQFTAVTSISGTLTGATTVEASAVGMDGAPQAGTYTLHTGLPVQMGEPGEPSWPGQIPGHERTQRRTCRVQYDETWTPREGDVVQVPATGETWQVSGRPQVQGAGMAPDHWKVKLEQQQGA